MLAKVSHYTVTPNLKPANIISYAYAEALAIAKFKTYQCILMTDSPNLMVAKVSHYTVTPPLFQLGTP